MKKFTVAVFALFLVGQVAAWTCPDLSRGVPPDLWDYQVYHGQVTGHDEFTKITIASVGVACLYNTDNPTTGLVLIRYGAYLPIRPKAEYWHYVGGGTSARYCTVDREMCSYR